MRSECPGIVENILCAEHFRRHIVCADKSAHIGGPTESVIRCLSLCLCCVGCLWHADASADAGHRYVNHHRPHRKIRVHRNAFEYFHTLQLEQIHVRTRVRERSCNSCSIALYVNISYQWTVSLGHRSLPPESQQPENTPPSSCNARCPVRIARWHRACALLTCAPHKSRDHHTLLVVVVVEVPGAWMLWCCWFIAGGKRGSGAKHCAII